MGEKKENDERFKNCFFCRYSSWPVRNERCYICYNASEWEPEDDERAERNVLVCRQRKRKDGCMEQNAFKHKEIMNG